MVVAGMIIAMVITMTIIMMTMVPSVWLRIGLLAAKNGKQEQHNTKKIFLVHDE